MSHGQWPLHVTIRSSVPATIGKPAAFQLRISVRAKQTLIWARFTHIHGAKRSKKRLHGKAQPVAAASTHPVRMSLARVILHTGTCSSTCKHRHHRTPYSKYGTNS